MLQQLLFSNTVLFSECRFKISSKIVYLSSESRQEEQVVCRE